MKNTSHPRAFTLIEIMVVIALLGILASIVYANLAVAKTKAVDTHKKADMATVRTALQSFNLDHNRMPHNYDCSSGTCVVNDNRPTLAIEDVDHPTSPTTESGKAYKASMQELVDGKYITSIPHAPGGAGYTYYDYGPGSAAGAVIGTDMGADEPTTTGRPGTCRPFPDSGTITANDAGIPARALTAVVGLGGGPLGGWEACSYIDEEGLWRERPCDAGVSTHNLCSTANSSDYCLCSPY